jgi:hypothetical protein
VWRVHEPNDVERQPEDRHELAGQCTIMNIIVLITIIIIILIILI